MLHGGIQTVFGWTLRASPKTRWRSVANFPMQANGAEILRLACCELTEAGIEVCAPIHDSVLIEAPVDQIQDTAAKAREIMQEASQVVFVRLSS